MYQSIRRAYLSKRYKTSSDNLLNQNSSFQTSKIPKKISDKIVQKTNKIEDNKNNTSINQSFTYKNDIKNQILHERNLKIIENLQKELCRIEKENESISENLKTSEETKKKLIEEHDKVISDIEREKKECDELKETTITKKREFLDLIVQRNQRQRALNIIERIINNNNANANRNILMNNRRNRRIDTNRMVAFRSAIERLVDLYRRRRDNEDDPPIPYEQLQALPSTTYPRNNRTNEKCILCGFEFCYNDIIIKLTNCNHIFHKNCLVNRLTIRQSSRFAICRVSIIQ